MHRERGREGRREREREKERMRESERGRGREREKGRVKDTPVDISQKSKFQKTVCGGKHLLKLWWEQLEFNHCIISNSLWD